MRGLIKGLTAFSIVTIFVVSAFLIGGVFKAQSVYAQHSPTVTINPNIANCDQLGDTFTVYRG